MITITGHCQIDYEVDIDVSRFEDIDDDHMSTCKSDEIIARAIMEKYNIDKVTKIFVNYSK
jgi:hypothetical protein